jgi:hypothetical protein
MTTRRIEKQFFQLGALMVGDGMIGFLLVIVVLSNGRGT